MAKVIRPDIRHFCSTMLPLLLWALVALAITGCAAPLPQPDGASRAAAHQATVPEPDPLPSPMFASPLPTWVSTPPRDPLWHNIWRITEIVQGGQEVAFDALGAVTLTFDDSGYLAVHTEHCGVAAYFFAYGYSPEARRSYTLSAAEMTAQDCGEPRNTQFHQVVSALEATGADEIQDERLVLSGDDVRIVLDIAESRGLLKTQPNGALVEPLWRHSWQVQEIVHGGQEVALDALGAVTLMFRVGGYLVIDAERCNYGAYRMAAAGEQQYLLVGGHFTQVLIIGDPQLLTRCEQMTSAVAGTQAYEFQDDHLVLYGKDVHIVLEADETYPPFPGAHPVLILNLWQWVEGVHHGQALAFDRLQPLVVGFSEYGTVSLFSEGTRCGVAGSYRALSEDGKGYQLVQEEPLRLNCGGDVNAQFQAAADTLAATTRFAIEDEWLILTGEGVRIVLAPWSQAQ
jgi:hypothetical protein